MKFAVIFFQLDMSACTDEKEVAYKVKFPAMLLHVEVSIFRNTVFLHNVQHLVYSCH